MDESLDLLNSVVLGLIPLHLNDEAIEQLWQYIHSLLMITPKNIFR
jgi:hypothetical protein